MKKIIFMLAFMLSSISIFAQQWTQKEFKADELKGTDGYMAYTYKDENGNSFIYWSNTEKKLRLINKVGIFDSDSYGNVLAKLGFYDESGNLVKKKDFGISTISNSYSMAENKYSKESAMILKYLKEQKGYIRILAPMFQSVSPWEIKVPCLNNEK